VERVLPGAIGQRVGTLLRHGGTAGTAAKGSISGFMVSGVGVLVSFALQTTLARSLGDQEYGTYTVVLVWMNVVLLVTKVDLDFVTTRFVGAYAATADWPRLHGLLRHVPRYVFLRTLIVAALALATLFAMRGSRFDHFVVAGLMAVPLFMLTAQVVLRSAAVQGFKRVLASQIPPVIVRPAVVLASIWLLLAFGGRMHAWIAIAFNVVASAVALLLAERAVRQVTPSDASVAPPVSEMKLWLRTGYGLVMISAAQLTFSQHTDILLVAAIIGRTNSGYYAVATQLAIMVAFASTAVMLIVAPLISELWAMRKLETLRSFTRATVSVCMVISFALLLVIVLLGRKLLSLFGSSFTVAYPAMVLLAFSHFISASVGALSGWLMTMTGHERPAAVMIGGTGLFNIALAIPMTMAFGIVGTATSTLISTLLRSLLLGVYLNRRLGLLIAPGPFRGAAT
jgi:O-antigen/teichoic acid export membrane protein